MNDPRTYPDPAAAAPEHARLYAQARASLGAATGQESEAIDKRLGDALDDLLRPGQGKSLSALFATAPSNVVYRHLWRLLAMRERAGGPDPTLWVRLFALPIIIVAAAEASGSAGVTLTGIIDDSSSLVAILRKHRAVSGNETLVLGNALVGAEALGWARLPEILAWRALTESPVLAHALAPAPMAVTAGAGAAHLRFLVGSAIVAPGADLMREDQVGGWGMPFAQALARALSAPGITVLALPRPPQSLVMAVWAGCVAQREVGAQLFASNAIRKLRAELGEPTAVISAHRLDAGGGEVRLSLSSPFDPRQAEGLRCPLFPMDRVDDVVQMLRTLLSDCRVTDVRVRDGIHGDRDPATGLPLLFKGDGPRPASTVN